MLAAGHGRHDGRARHDRRARHDGRRGRMVVRGSGGRTVAPGTAPRDGAGGATGSAGATARPVRQARPVRRPWPVRCRRQFRGRPDAAPAPSAAGFGWRAGHEAWLDGRRDAQGPLVLVHRVLAEQRAVDAARAQVAHARRGGLELVHEGPLRALGDRDVRCRPALAHGRVQDPQRRPPRGHVGVVTGRVEGRATRDDACAVPAVDAAGAQVERQHRERAEPGELRGHADAVAVEEGAARGAPARRGECPARQPVGDRGGAYDAAVRVQGRAGSGIALRVGPARVHLGSDEGQPGRCGGDGQADDAPGQTRADEPAVQVEGAHQARLGRVGHVDLRDADLGLVGGQRHQPGAAAGGRRRDRAGAAVLGHSAEQEHGGALNQELLGAPVGGQTADDAYLPVARAQYRQPAVRAGRDGEHEVAALLGHVGLVDTGDLDVGAGGGGRAGRLGAGGRRGADGPGGGRPGAGGRGAVRCSRQRARGDSAEADRAAGDALAVEPERTDER